MPLSRKTKFFISIWFIFSWIIIIFFSLKPLGIINTFKIFINSFNRYIFTPSEVQLFGFEKMNDFFIWSWKNVCMEQAKDFASEGTFSAKVTYYAGPYSGLICEDYNLGPKAEKNWSYFKLFKVDIFNPQKENLNLHIKIKDKAERYVDKELKLKEGRNQITINLEELGEFIDLHNIAYLNFYFIGLAENKVIYLDNLKLERANLKEKSILSQPVVNFLKLLCPKEIRKGNPFILEAYLSLEEKLNLDYDIFIHISYSKEIKKIPLKRKYFLSINQKPWIPTSQWKVKTFYKIGPFSIYIPKGFASGEYFIQLGLFNSGAHGFYYKGSSYKGRVNFRAGYPRLNYTNKNIKNFIVGKIKVKD